MKAVKPSKAIFVIENRRLRSLDSRPFGRLRRYIDSSDSINRAPGTILAPGQTLISTFTAHPLKLIICQDFAVEHVRFLARLVCLKASLVIAVQIPAFKSRNLHFRG